MCSGWKPTTTHIGDCYYHEQHSLGNRGRNDHLVLYRRALVFHYPRHSSYLTEFVRFGMGDTLYRIIPIFISPGHAGIYYSVIYCLYLPAQSK